MTVFNSRRQPIEGTNTMTKGNEEQSTTGDSVFAEMEDIVVRSMMPGYIIKLSFSKINGRKSRRENVRMEEIQNPDGSIGLEKTWDGKEINKNPEEDKAADELSEDIRKVIERLAIRTKFGTVVPTAKKKELFLTLFQSRQRINLFNDSTNDVGLRFTFQVGKSEAENKLAIANINQQLDEILEQVNRATQLDDSKVLEQAREKELTIESLGEKRILSPSQVLNGAPERRREVVALIRARLVRESLNEANSFKDQLPEETGQAVSSLVDDLRKKARAWVKASKQDDAAYEKALEAVDNEGISDMQAALIRAAQQANQAIDDELLSIAENDGDIDALIGANPAPAPITPLDGDDDIDGIDGSEGVETPMFVGFGASPDGESAAAE